jgi:DNA-directed RNA polymerase specialized sigma24 family protein
VNDHINFNLVTRIARNAAVKVTKTSGATTTADLQQDLLVYVLEKQKMFDRYINVDSPLSLRERENKLYVSLLRQASKILNDYIKVSRSEVVGLFEDGYNYDIEDYSAQASHLSAIPYHHPWEQMTDEQVLGLLPFVLLPDEEIPVEVLEKVGILRGAVASCTQPQVAVISRLAQGMDLKEIAEDLGISVNTINKRLSRAKLKERCEVPVHMRFRR